MINETEAQELIEKLLILRNEGNLSKLQKHEKICVDKFSYLVTMRTNRYKNFANHDDLVQEGFEALFRGIQSYDAKKGSIFWWLHKYIDTKISRIANQHSTIRYPLKVAKENVPHKESSLPVMTEESDRPDHRFEKAQLDHLIDIGLKGLSNEHKEIVNMYFGLENDKPMSINLICQRKGIPRNICIKLINNAVSNIKKTANI